MKIKRHKFDFSLMIVPSSTLSEIVQGGKALRVEDTCRVQISAPCSDININKTIKDVKDELFSRN